MPLLMMNGVQIKRLYRFDRAVDQCEGINIPSTVKWNAKTSYCRCVKDAHKENKDDRYCELLIQKLDQLNRDH